MRPSLKSSMSSESSPSEAHKRPGRLARDVGPGSSGENERGIELTARGFNLENAFLCGTVLKGIQKRCLNGKKSPLGLGGRCRGQIRAVDDSLVAAPDGGAVDGQIERRHLHKSATRWLRRCEFMRYRIYSRAQLSVERKI